MISKKEIRLFLVLFLALNVVFLFYQCTLFVGNHDWDWMKGTTQHLRLDTGLFEGRYAKFIFNMLLFDGNILPWLNTLVGFAFLASGAVLLGKYWQLPSLLARLFVGLSLVLMPFILGWLYFPLNLIGNFFSVFAVVLGLMLAEKSCWWKQGLAIGCFLLALGVYPSAVEMMPVCFCFRNILIFPKDKREFGQPLGCLCVGIVGFKMILWGLTVKGLIFEAQYNMQTATLSVLWEHFKALPLWIVQQFWATSPFFPRGMKIVMTMIVLGALFLQNKKTLPFFVVALGATVLSAFLTRDPSEVLFMPRVNFYGLNAFMAGATAVLLVQKKRAVKNIGMLLSGMLIFMSVCADCYAQKVWSFGLAAENNLIERLTSRVEKRGLGEKQLIPVVAGELSLRPRYYTEAYDKSSPYVLEKSFMVRHIPSGMLNFYAVEPWAAPNSAIYDLSAEIYAFLTEAPLPWPAERGLYVDDRYMILLLTAQGISDIQAQLPQQ
jgi:hypothetical protein